MSDSGVIIVVPGVGEMSQKDVDLLRCVQLGADVDHELLPDLVSLSEEQMQHLEAFLGPPAERRAGLASEYSLPLPSARAKARAKALEGSFESSSTTPPDLGTQLKKDARLLSNDVVHQYLRESKDFRYLNLEPSAQLLQRVRKRQLHARRR